VVRLSILRDRPAEGEQEGADFFEHVTVRENSALDASDPRTAHDRRIRPDLAQRVDVIPVFDAETDGDGYLCPLTQGADNRCQCAVVGWGGAGSAVVRSKIDVGGSVLRGFVEHSTRRSHVTRGYDGLAQKSSGLIVCLPQPWWQGMDQ
jgi:hypothetical protein